MFTWRHLVDLSCTPIPCSCPFLGSADLCLCASPRYSGIWVVSLLSPTLSLPPPLSLSLSLRELDRKGNIMWHLCQSHDPNVCLLTKHLGMGQSPKPAHLIMCNTLMYFVIWNHPSWGLIIFDPYPQRPAACYKAVFKFLTAANGVQGHRSLSASHVQDLKSTHQQISEIIPCPHTKHTLNGMCNLPTTSLFMQDDIEVIRHKWNMNHG